MVIFSRKMNLCLCITNAMPIASQIYLSGILVQISWDSYHDHDGIFRAEKLDSFAWQHIKLFFKLCIHFDSFIFVLLICDVIYSTWLIALSTIRWIDLCV